MPPTVRVATFNVENLFARYKFNKDVDPAKAVIDGWRADQRQFDIYDEISKTLTAQAIKAAKADILALQEVENLDTLKRFRSLYLGGRKLYPHALSIDGNDPRQIDVAVLSKFPLVKLRSYQEQWDAKLKQYVFSRDCLEVDVLLPSGATLTLFVNHLKSMLDKDDPCHGRSNTRAKRESQAQAVRAIVEGRFGAQAGAHPFIVLGDLNDYLATDAQGPTGIADLAQWDQVVNVVDRLPAEEQWTHFYKGDKKCGFPPSYRQIDYLLLSTSLAAANPGAPEVMRKGMPTRANRYTGSRFPGVGLDKPKASDHCPLIMELTL